MTELWCPWAIKLLGPEAKMGYGGSQKMHPKVGLVVHSMEYESTPEWDDATTLHNALFSEREASWTFSITWFLNGEALFQHYPIGAVCWAQGYEGNLWLDSVELEDVWKTGGGITEGQYQLLVKLGRWHKAANEDSPLPWRIGGRKTMFPAVLSPVVFEHNAVPGAPYTECQVFTHGKVDAQRLLADLNREEEDMGVFVRMDTKLEVYQVVGSKLFHVVTPELLALLTGDTVDPWRHVKVLPPDHFVWELPVERARTS